MGRTGNISTHLSPLRPADNPTIEQRQQRLASDGDDQVVGYQAIVDSYQFAVIGTECWSQADTSMLAGGIYY